MTGSEHVANEYEGNRNRSQTIEAWNRALSAKAELPKRDKEPFEHYSSPRGLTHSKLMKMKLRPITLALPGAATGWRRVKVVKTDFGVERVKKYRERHDKTK